MTVQNKENIYTTIYFTNIDAKCLHPEFQKSNPSKIDTEIK